MVACVSARLFAVAAALVITVARAHMHSHDNILRIQLWDAEGLTRIPITTPPTPSKVKNLKKNKVNLDHLYSAMIDESSGNDFGRFIRHKTRHKRRRPRQVEDELPWRFHQGTSPLNVVELADGMSSAGVESVTSAVSESAVSQTKDVPPPMTQRQDFQDEDEEVKKQLPVVPKCCASGQNLSAIEINGRRTCSPSLLTFQPLFHKFNDTHIWEFEGNLYETLVGNPCSYDRYKLDPTKDSDDEFYLLVNGSLFAPFHTPYSLSPKNFCMETFWNESNPAGVTLPLVCFPPPLEEAGTSATFVAYAIGLLVSVPFALATAFVYLFIRELRDTHGKALACHTTSLAIAFLCLATTQLAGRSFSKESCVVMAYLIQFSFVACFFWLNVMCFDIYLNVRRYITSTVSRRSMRRRFLWYCAYAVTCPVVLVVVTITMDLAPAVPSTYLKPNIGVRGCWFKTDDQALPYFYGPVAVILLSNIIIFFLTSREFALHYDKLKDFSGLELTHSEFSSHDDWVRLGAVLGETLERTSPSRDRTINLNQRLKKYRKIFRTCCILTVIMGLSWVMEVVSWAAGAGTAAVSVWSVFDVINALQGVVIFAIYVLQQPVRAKVKSSSLCSLCRRSSGSEMMVVSERTSIDCGSGRRDYV